MPPECRYQVMVQAVRARCGGAPAGAVQPGQGQVVQASGANARGAQSGHQASAAVLERDVRLLHLGDQRQRGGDPTAQHHGRRWVVGGRVFGRHHQVGAMDEQVQQGLLAPGPGRVNARGIG